jgi:DNA-binding transcriptional MerR regulator
MRRKRTLEEIRQLELVKVSELAEINRVRYSTIKFYTELGLLPFEQKGARLAKFYPRVKASERLREILKLRERGKSIAEVIDHLLKASV